MKYGRRILFKRGITVSVSLLYKCNLNCTYCSLKNFSHEQPHDTVIHPAEDWVKFIESFPIRIKEIFLTGGEPGIYSQIVPLTNELLSRGYFVTIFTNLTKISEFLSINESPNLKFQATYHRGANIETFKENYNTMTRFFRVDVDEIESSFLSYSKKKDLCTLENERDTSRFRIDSDMRIYTNCFDRNKAHL